MITGSLIKLPLSTTNVTGIMVSESKGTISVNTGDIIEIVYQIAVIPTIHIPRSIGMFFQMMNPVVIGTSCIGIREIYNCHVYGTKQYGFYFEAIRPGKCSFGIYIDGEKYSYAVEVT